MLILLQTWKRSSETASRPIDRPGIETLGFILDTSILIANERRGGTVSRLVQNIYSAYAESQIALSSVSVVELTHGIYRARTEADRIRRQTYAGRAFADLVIHPVTFEIARLAGQIEGEQAAREINIAFEDLVIGCTALYLDYEVATLNTKHFELIPGLRMVAL